MEHHDKGWMIQMREFIKKHRWAITLMMVGLIICVLILTINFWRTLLICAVVSICLLIGTLMDKGGWDMVRAFLDRVLPKG